MKNKTLNPYFPIRLEVLNTVESKMVVKEKAIINDETNKVVSIVSDQYQVVDNSTVVKSFEEYLNDSGVEYQQMDSFCDRTGKRFYAKYRFPEIQRNFGTHKTQFGEVPDDVQMQIELFNSYDGSSKIGFSISGYRLVCLNGMRVDERIYSFAAKHTKSQIGDDIEGLITLSFETAKEIFMNIADDFEQIKMINFDKARAAQIIKSMEMSKMYIRKFGSYYKDELPEIKTMWDFYNLITWFTTHVVEQRNYNLARKLATTAASGILH